MGISVQHNEPKRIGNLWNIFGNQSVYTPTPVQEEGQQNGNGQRQQLPFLALKFLTRTVGTKSSRPQGFNAYSPNTLAAFSLCRAGTSAGQD